MKETTFAPDASEFTSSPLRNRIRVDLNAEVPAVWELMGDLTRFPEYSVGLERVVAETDSSGRCVEYTCYFKPVEDGAEAVVSRDIMRWYEPNRGYLSEEISDNRTVALMTLEATSAGTRMTYDMHFESDDLEATEAVIDAALIDIAENLIRRFGGSIVERYVET